jgi:hypothetical protein
MPSPFLLAVSKITVSGQYLKEKRQYISGPALNFSLAVYFRALELSETASITDTHYDCSILSD